MIDGRFGVLSAGASMSASKSKFPNRQSSDAAGIAVAGTVRRPALRLRLPASPPRRCRRRFGARNVAGRHPIARPLRRPLGRMHLVDGDTAEQDRRPPPCRLSARLDRPGLPRRGCVVRPPGTRWKSAVGRWAGDPYALVERNRNFEPRSIGASPSCRPGWLTFF